jgi:hypothetical protein
MQTTFRSGRAAKESNNFGVRAPQFPNAWRSVRMQVEETANTITIPKPKGAR